MARTQYAEAFSRSGVSASDLNYQREQLGVQPFGGMLQGKTELGQEIASFECRIKLFLNCSVPIQNF